MSIKHVLPILLLISFYGVSSTPLKIDIRHMDNPMFELYSSESKQVYHQGRVPLSGYVPAEQVKDPLAGLIYIRVSNNSDLTDTETLYVPLTNSNVENGIFFNFISNQKSMSMRFRYASFEEDNNYGSGSENGFVGVRASSGFNVAIDGEPLFVRSSVHGRITKHLSFLPKDRVKLSATHKETGLSDDVLWDGCAEPVGHDCYVSPGHNVTIHVVPASINKRDRR